MFKKEILVESHELNIFVTSDLGVLSYSSAHVCKYFLESTRRLPELIPEFLVSFFFFYLFTSSMLFSAYLVLDWTMTDICCGDMPISNKRKTKKKTQKEIKTNLYPFKHKIKHIDDKARDENMCSQLCR